MKVAFYHQLQMTEKARFEASVILVGGSGMTVTMILSKSSLYQGFLQRHFSQNVGIHEFVHLLDRAEGPQMVSRKHCCNSHF